MDCKNSIILEISKEKFKFFLLETENNRIVSKIVCSNSDMFQEILSSFKAGWNKRMDDYYYATYKKTGSNPEKNDKLSEIEVDEDSLTICAKSIYIMGQSQVRAMQWSINKMLSASEYIAINKILLAYEKALRLKAEPEHETELGFYLFIF